MTPIGRAGLGDVAATVLSPQDDIAAALLAGRHPRLAQLRRLVRRVAERAAIAVKRCVDECGRHAHLVGDHEVR